MCLLIGGTLDINVFTDWLIETLDINVFPDWLIVETLDINVFPVAVAADIISTVEFSHSGELLATGDKGGRVVIFQQDPEVRTKATPYTPVVLTLLLYTHS